MLLAILLLGVIFLLIFSNIICWYNERYWRKHGVPYQGGKNMLGIFWDFLIGKKALFVLMDDVYKEFYNAPAVGMASIFVPSLLVKDPKNIQHVLAENFKAFFHRGVDVNPSDTLADNVLFMNGPRWKLTRQKMTPLFTSAKLKNMHYIMDKSARDFVDYLLKNDLMKNSTAFDSLRLFCCASIGGAVFGVKTGTSTFESPFFNIATEALEPTLISNLKFAFATVTPALFKAFGVKFFAEYEKRFVSAIKQILRERENDAGKYHDFADLAISIQKNGTMRDDSTGLEINPTDELMAGQAFFFLIAGVDPTATGMLGILLELSRHPDILKKVHDEIDKAFEEHKGVITFDVISKLTYLDQVVEESLRMHPPIGQIGRRCTEDAVLPVGNIKVDKGTQVTVPIFSLHYDPQYYPNPNVFDPERFSPEAVKKRENMTFMPFGEGNRLCVGSRFAYLQMKTGLLHILRNFSVKIDDPNMKVEYEKSPVALRIKNAIFRFVLRDNN